MDDYDAARFLRSITKSRYAPKPAPSEPPKIEPPPQPQAPIETKPVGRDAEFRKRFLNEIDGQRTLEEIFGEDADGLDKAMMVIEWIRTNRDGYISHHHVLEESKLSS